MSSSISFEILIRDSQARLAEMQQLVFELRLDGSPSWVELCEHALKRQMLESKLAALHQSFLQALPPVISHDTCDESDDERPGLDQYLEQLDEDARDALDPTDTLAPESRNRPKPSHQKHTQRRQLPSASPRPDARVKPWKGAAAKDKSKKRALACRRDHAHQAFDE